MASKMDDLTFLQYVRIVVAVGNEGQLAVVGEEEEVHSSLDFCDRGQWGGKGILQWLHKEIVGIVLGKGLSECISDSHRLQLSALVVAVLSCCWLRGAMTDCFFVCAF